MGPGPPSQSKSPQDPKRECPIKPNPTPEELPDPVPSGPSFPMMEPEPGMIEPEPMPIEIPINTSTTSDTQGSKFGTQ